jgi:hypothetical protein
MTDIVVHSKYKRRSQFRELHKRKQRWAILVCHRRAGKKKLDLLSGN